ncbi:BPSS1780 family membrane protein [Caldimonas tepidiphila]|uniref:BPSS1780 family membrane protein n=1 Tax=Caldimonas tepidiphila TaxID=2315841 RepID=UPI0013002F83|nr:BPSS1780 family membrane protein [Caldimonas tepidiphila]
MKLRLVPPRQGVQWVRQGFRVYFRQPLAYTALFFLFLFGAFLLASLPLVGMPVLLMLLPAVTQGFMIATQKTVSGGMPLPGVFVVPFKRDKGRARAQLQLGLAYTAISVLVMFLADALDGGSLEALQESIGNGESGGTAQPQAPAMEFGLLLRFALALPVSLLFWHAPALIHWGGASPLQSIFYSAIACWRNLGAFAVYFFAWIGVIGLFTILLTLTMSLLGQPQLAAVAAMPAALMFSTVFYASLYFTFVDCFEQDPAPAPQ